jgi:hypothetical protein
MPDVAALCSTDNRIVNVGFRYSLTTIHIPLIMDFRFESETFQMRPVYVIAIAIPAAVVGSTAAVAAVDENRDPSTAEWVADTLLNTGVEMDDAERKALAGRIDVEQFNSYTIMGKTLVRAKLTMTIADIDSVFERQQQGNPVFRRTIASTGWTEFAFGDRPIVNLGSDGPTDPEWWKPFDAKASEYAAWQTQYPNQPRTWIDIQVCESENAERVAYLRIQSD